ncbi:MAG TPA: glycogen synthase [Chloroflexi bacterium]|nr:glycogen synthase [Chloroflexota bacterium]
MNVTFIAVECAPFVKVGGLGDVVGTLPRVLARLGEHVSVVVPHHGVIDDARFGLRPLTSFDMVWNESTTRVDVAATEWEGVTVYFIRGWPFFDAGERFVYSHDEGIDVGRFLFFSAAALALVRRMAEAEAWQPDLFHIHDWHTSTVPYLLQCLYRGDPILGGAATLLSIHNIRYQGRGVGWHLARAGLPPVDHPLLRAMGQTDNTLAIGLAYSTMLSTVSPTYAREIADPEGGYGLDGLVHARLSRLVGVLNGIDVQRWNPATSPHLTARYDADSLERRAENKRALQREIGLPECPDVPLMGAVMRLVEQKGPGILFPAVRRVLSEREAQFVLLGTGMPHYEDQARQLGRDFPGRASVNLTFNELLAERIYAGIDLFLMPSLFEPCGLGQMIAMRYGALPVARAVGGLVDTVTPDTGFLFADYDAGALRGAIHQALDVYTGQPDRWRERQRRAMQRDFSWERSARRYVDLYRQAVRLHRQVA